LIIILLFRRQVLVREGVSNYKELKFVGKIAPRIAGEVRDKNDIFQRELEHFVITRDGVRVI
jgi:hypothetical protein